MNFKNKDKFYIILFTVVAVILVWAFLSAAIITKNFKKDMEENKLENKKVLVEDLLLTETKDGKKFWEIYADKGYYEDNQKKAFIVDSIGNFYDENEQVVASFKSPKAILNSETGEITLYDRSEFLYKDFTSVIADKFTYSGNNNPILAEGNVLIKNPGQYEITAENADLTNHMTKITVKGKVLTKIYEKGK